MALDKEKKQSIIGAYKTHEKDTGSAEVQVALLSERISYLTEHFKTWIRVARCIKKCDEAERPTGPPPAVPC